MRKSLIIAGLAFALILAIALVAPSFVDWNRYRGAVTGLVADATGRAVTIDGDLSFAVLPTPHLAAASVTIANAPGFSPAPMVRIARLHVAVALLPLLAGEVEVKRLVLKAPHILLEKDAAGRGNWRMAEGVADAPAKTPAIGIDDLVIEDGVLAYIAAPGATPLRFEDIAARLAIGSLEGPFSGRVALRYGALPFRAEVKTGRLGEAGAPLFLKANLADKAASLAFDGMVEEDGGYNGRVTLESPSLARLANALGGGKGAAQQSLPDRPLQLVGRLEAERGARFALTDMALGVGKSQGAGKAVVDVSGPLAITLALAFSRLDIGDLLPPPRDDAPPVGPFPLPLLSAGKADVTLTIAALAGVPGEPRDLGIRARLADGALFLDDVAVTLAGDSRARMKARLFPVDGMAALEGTLNITSAAPRALAKAFASEAVARLPANALGRFALEGAIALRGDMIELADVKATLDDSRLVGSLGYGLRARPAISIDAAIDRLDIDRYLPAADNAAPRSTVPSAPDLGALAANVKLRVGALGRGGETFEQAVLRATLVQGVFTIAEAALGDARDARLALKGTVRDLDGGAKLDLALEGAGAGLDRLARLAGMTPPPALAATGPFQLAGTAAGSFKDLGIDIRANVGSLAATTRGRLRNLDADAPAVDLTLEASHHSLAALLAQFGLRDAAGTSAGQPLKISLRFKGAPDDLVAAGQISAGRGAITLSLDQKGVGDARRFSAAINARAPKFAAFVRDLGFDFAPAREASDAFSLDLKLAGDGRTVAIETFDAVLGPASLAGGGRIETAGEVPVATLDLAASVLDLNAFLPPAETGAAPAAAQGGTARWSEEAMDWAFLKTLDGRLQLQTEALIFDVYRLEGAKFILTSQGPTARVEALSGRLFGGNAKIAASIDASATPQYAFSMDLDGASLAQATQALAAMAPMTGTMAFTGRFEGKGLTQKALVASLGGGGRLTVKDGVIRRVDMARINQKLGQLETINDFLRLMGAALGGGETAYRTMAVDFSVKDGVARTANMVSDIDGGADVTLDARLDLPAWAVDAKGGFRLRDHVQAPPIGVTMKGNLSGPEIAYQTKALQQYMATRLGAAVLKGVVRGEGVGLKDLLSGGKTPGTSPSSPASEPATPPPSQPTADAPSSQASPPPAPKKPEEEIRDLLLEGLFAKKKKPPAEPPPAAPPPQN
ncbi:MAG: AsmA family protein [Pseudomonadota bacterium]